MRPSKSRPEQGLIKVRTTALQPKQRDGAGARLEPDRAASFKQHAKRKLSEDPAEKENPDEYT